MILSMVDPSFFIRTVTVFMTFNLEINLLDFQVGIRGNRIKIFAEKLPSGISGTDLARVTLAAPPGDHVGH